MKLVILAGGRGTRMGALAAACPKPMVPIAGKPILAYQLELAGRYGVRDVIVLLGHMGDAIRSHFGSQWQGMHLEYLQEEQPLGTAGAVRSAQSLLDDDDFLVFYGDTIVDIDLHSLTSAHRQGGRYLLGTLVVHPNNHPYDSDIVEVQDGRIVAIHSKPHPTGFVARNLVSAALYVLNPKIFEHIELDRFADFGRDVFPRIVRAGHALGAYHTAEYIKDVGTPERHGEVEHDLLSGKVARLNRAHARPCVFLDRDGTLNREIDCVGTEAELDILPGVATAIKALNQSDYLAVVTTNQPGIAKGFLNEAELERIHGRLETELGREHAYIDRIYVCPHHPERGHAGERSELKIVCSCRKPEIGLILRATAELNIDLSRSFIVGDRTADVLTGIRAGVKPILIRTGYAGSDAKYECQPAATCEDVAAAVELILRS